MIDKIRKEIKRRQIAKKNTHAHKLSSWDLIKRYLDAKLPGVKLPVKDPNMSLVQTPPENEINYIAIVLDGKVEEVFRAQNRLTALLLSGPDFVDFDPSEVYPKIGISEYRDGKFFNAEKPVHKEIEEISDNV